MGTSVCHPGRGSYPQEAQELSTGGAVETQRQPTCWLRPERCYVVDLNSRQQNRKQRSLDCRADRAGQFRPLSSTIGSPLSSRTMKRSASSSIVNCFLSG